MVPLMADALFTFKRKDELRERIIEYQNNCEI